MTKAQLIITITYLILVANLVVVINAWLIQTKRCEELKKRLCQENPPGRPSQNDLPFVPITAVSTVPYDVVKETPQGAENIEKIRLAKLLGQQVIKYANIYTEPNVRDMNYRVVAQALVIDQSSLTIRPLFPGEDEKNDVSKM